MAVKHYVDEIPPSTGRVYEITPDGNKSRIEDVTEYEQEGTGFGANDVNCTCVLECNYAKSGTVHQLTTENTTSENIKFYATSTFYKGDTFTFNGKAVTAKTMDGLPLGNKFFTYYTIVECRKRGDVLYFANSKSIGDDKTTASYRIGVEDGNMYIEY